MVSMEAAVQRKTVFMFSGQGSQYYQMAGDLYEILPSFKQKLDQLDQIAADYLGESVLAELFDPRHTKSAPFENLRYTHPAIVMVEYAIYQHLLEQGLQADVVLGASLGEFAASAAAGVITPEQMLQMVICQSEQFQWQAPKGGMLAIIDNYQTLLSRGFDFTGCTIAGHNFASHFVVAGSEANLDRLQAQLQSQEILQQRLPVKYAFHSAAIEVVENAFLDEIRSLPLQAPQTGYWSCLTGQSIQSVGHDHFWRVVRQPMLFQEAIAGLERLGPCDYVDVGPSGTLCNFARRNLAPGSSSKAFAVLNLFGPSQKGIDGIVEALSAPAVYS